MTDRLITAEVYLRNGGKVYLSAPPTEEVLNRVFSGMALEGVNTKGAKVALTPGAYVSAVGPEPAYAALSKVKVPSSIYDGRHTLITSAANMLRSHRPGDDEANDLGSDYAVVRGAVEDDDAPFTVVVQAEDMASALVLIMDLRRADDDLVWINPASDSRAIDNTVKAVRLLAEAEQLEILAYDPASDHTVTAPGYADPEAEGRRLADAYTHTVDIPANVNKAFAQVEANEAKSAQLDEVAILSEATEADFLVAYRAIRGHDKPFAQGGQEADDLNAVAHLAAGHRDAAIAIVGSPFVERLERAVVEGAQG